MTARPADSPAWVSVLRKARLPVLLPAGANRLAIAAWDAWACARPAARVDDWQWARRDADAGKSAGQARDVPALDASLPPPRRLYRQALLAARALYTPGAAQSAERSFVAAAAPMAMAQSGLQALLPWWAFAAQALWAAASLQWALWKKPWGAAQESAQTLAVAQAARLEPQIEEEQAAPEP